MTTVTDDFNRADNTSLGSNYTTYVGSFGNRITSNTCRAGNTGSSEGSHWATASNTFGSDQFSKATIAVALNAGGSNVYLSMCVRISGSGGTRDLYQFTCNASTWYLTRVDNGTGTDIASGSRSQVVGEEVECRAVGSTISGWIDGVEITSVTDTAYTSGQPGFEVYNSGTTLAAWDDWSGGDLSAAPTTTNVTGSATAAVGIAETYTYTLDASPAGTVTVTPTAPVAGSWSPTTVGLTSGNWNTGLTSNFTASAAGSGNISSTNDGGLTNDTLAVTVYSTSRPSAVTAGSWTDEAGGSLVVADINDASDSTGAMDPAGASYPVLAFTATTPLTATSQTFYFRGRDIAAGKQARQVIYANDGTTVVATGAWKTMTGSLATYSDVLTPTATAYKGQIQTQAAPTTPSHYSSATSGEWYALPNSSLTSSGVGWSGTSPGGTSDYQATVTAWGGACLNTVGCYYDGAFHAGIFIILFGGGHGDYGGNEVYSYGPINSESPGFKRLTDPTVPGVENTARDGSGNPVSRHTYDTLAYDAAANRMLCLGAPGYFSLGNAYNACDAFDFDTNTWTALADLTTGGGGTGSVSACTVIDGTYAWVWPMGNGQYLNRIALSGDARTTYAKDFPTTRYGAKAGYDPVHEIMAWCSGSTVYAFDLRNPGSNVEYSPTTSGTAPTTGAPMAWDNANACFKVWADSGKTLFTLTPGANPYSGGDTWVWTSTTPAGGATPAAETTNGTHGRFQYNNSGDVIGALVMPNQTSPIYMFKP